MYDFKSRDVGAMPVFDKPDSAFLEAVGEDGLRKMISDFYDEVFESNIAHFFPQDEEELEEVKINSAEFFLQVFSGSSYFNHNKGGSKMMKMMHDNFSITEKDRVEWLSCFEVALNKTDAPQEAKDSFWDYVEKFSSWLVNVESEKIGGYDDMVKS